jgi:D-serine deaminase-like pyridoxal phosphate-dependent protein
VSDTWYLVSNVAEVASPALLIYPARAAENLRRMIDITGNASRLRPHIKTHKLPELITMHLERGITRFKCATIAEAEMVAACHAPDVLLAYPPVGPNIQRLLQLVNRYPGTRFSAIADDADSIRALSAACVAAGKRIEVLLDIDCGMHRTGVAPGPEAFALYRLIHESPGLWAGGLHAYDGHLRDTDLEARRAQCSAAFAPVDAFRQELLVAGLPVPRLIAGGTPTFPIHAGRSDVECSPGTCVLWDFGYGDILPDLKFLNAALVLTRVISKPGPTRLCLDLGHKAIAAENPHPRVRFLNLPDAQAVVHSEEHLVVESPRAAEFPIGACLYGVPRHICPTVALHAEAVTIVDGVAQARWDVRARVRRINV